jgi:hypothetical protein
MGAQQRPLDATKVGAGLQELVLIAYRHLNEPFCNWVAVDEPASTTLAPVEDFLQACRSGYSGAM